MASLPKNPPHDKAKELRQQIDTSLDTLAKAVDDVRASERPTRSRATWTCKPAFTSIAGITAC